MSNQQTSQGYTYSRTAYVWAEFLLGQFARTVIVFFRYDFGERYFNVADVLGSSFTFLLTGSAIAVFAEALTGDTPTTIGKAAQDAQHAAQNHANYVLILFFICFLLMSLTHRLQSWDSKKHRKQWHSRYDGTSFISAILPEAAHIWIDTYLCVPLNMSERYIVQRFIEPTIAFGAGAVMLVTFNPPLGAWWMFAGLSLAFAEWIVNARSKNKLLDAEDAQIESSNLGAALSRTSQIKADATSGFVLPVSPRLDSKEQAKLAQGMRILNPELQAILDAPDIPAATASAGTPNPADYRNMMDY